MNWQKPQYQESRFGFEVTMYVYMKTDSTQPIEQVNCLQYQSPSHAHKLATMKVIVSLCAAACLLVFSSGSYAARAVDIQNTRSFSEGPINASNVGRLAVDWVYQTTPDTGTLSTPFGAISATPAVKGKYLYFNDISGNITKLNRFTGAVIWKKNYVNDLSLPGFGIKQSRNTPYVVNGLVIVGNSFQIGDQLCRVTGGLPNAIGCHTGDGAIVLALDKKTGNIVWKKKVDTHPSSKVTGSISGTNNMVLVPVGNWEEEWAKSSPDITQAVIDPNSQYPCCSSRGSLVALDLNTGNILWKTYTVPGNGNVIDSNDKNPTLSPTLKALLTPRGFFGTSAYGHNPTIDVGRSQVYIATAQNITAPKVAEDCEKQRRLTHDPHANIPGLPTGVTCSNLNDMLHNYASSIIALDLNTGKVKWAFHERQYDAWNHACAAADFNGIGTILPVVFPTPIANAKNCFQNPIGPDHGFGQMPMLIKNVKMQDGSEVDLVVAGNKDGRLFALNPRTGNKIWETNTDPGSLYGGLQFGRASDGKNIYFGTTNGRNINRDVNKPFVAAETFLTMNGFDALGIRIGKFTKYDDDVPVSFPAPSSQVLPFLGPQLFYGIPEYPSTYPDPDNTGAPAGFLKGPASGPSELWTLVNPPSDVVADGITVLNVDGQLKTIDGMVHAVDAATGRILWQRPAYDGIKGTLAPASAFGTLTVGNGVVFIGYVDSKGTMLALNANTGRKLFEFHNQIPVGSTMVNAGGIEGGPLVVGRRVYWGVGTDLLSFIPNKDLVFQGGGNRLYSFILPQQPDDDVDKIDRNTDLND